MAWHVGFVAALAVAVAVASLADPDAITAAIAGAVGVWYWLGRDRAPRPAARLLHLGGTAAGTLVLADRHQAFLGVAGFLCGPIFLLLPIAWAIPASLVVAAALAWIAAQTLGDAVFVGAAILATVAIFVGLYIQAIVGQSARRQSLIQELEATRRELAERERAAGIAAERQRLAREIHDTVTQDLVSTLRFVESAIREGPDHPVRRQLELAEAAARDGLAEARRLIWATRVSRDDSSLPEALGRVCDRFTRETGLATELSIASEIGTLPTEVEVTLLRATQETLANISKHARAHAVAVTISGIGNQIALDVQDDGVGFDPETTRPQVGVGGFGLTGLRERVEELGGAISIESAPGHGTTIGILLPITGKQEGGA